MITVEGLKVHFKKGIFRKDIKALDGLSLDVGEGDFFALLGRNGAGKSTAMYCMLGLLKPTAGSVRVFGEAPVLGTRNYAKIAYLPEEPHYHLYLSVEEAVNYYGSLYGGKVSKSRVDAILERLGLSKFRGLKLDKCSKGMKQKVGIAQCLINRPELMFLDEPTRGLDPLIVKEFRDILVEMNKSGTTIVMNSHVLSEIEMVANRVAIIDEGRLVVQDSLSNLLVSDSETYIVEFECEGEVPAYVVDAKKTGRGIKGAIPADKFYEFIDHAKAGGLRVFECSHKKTSLEESFFNILKAGGTDA